MGKIIVIDGLDACGKATQAERVYNRLVGMGYKVFKTDFPDYESLSSGPVRMYLSGELGDNPLDISPYTRSLFFAVDRAVQWITKIKQRYNDGYIVILDRYISANVIYQGTSFDTDEDKKEFFKWVYNFETQYGGLVKDDITICLTLPVEVSQKLMHDRYKGDDSKKDILEKNLTILNKSREVLELACNYLPTIGYNWKKLDCSGSSGWIQPMDVITDELMKMVEPILKSEAS